MRWEYLEVYVQVGDGVWTDSTGRGGRLPTVRQKQPVTVTWIPWSPLLTTLGDDGWELRTVVADSLATGTWQRLVFARGIDEDYIDDDGEVDAGGVSERDGA